jgi:hypothetical protein
MNQTQETIISILSAAIRGKKIENLKLANVNWLQVFEESQAHNITAVTYSTIKDLSEHNTIDEELLYMWKNISIGCAINQIRHIKQMSKVFKSFQEANIPVIALKGLVVREHYPHPEFRSMSDADILVHREDVEKAEIVLMNLGYYKHSSIEIHSSFDHKNYLSIDLHWTLVNELHIKTTTDFDKTLWENTMTVTMNALPILSLSLEYELLHLILHIASHMIKSGFGLRQLCDVVVFVEKEKDNIDWNLFFEKAKTYKIEKLVMTIFILCQELFNMDLPNEDSIQYFKRNQYIELLINELFSSGVFGKRNPIRINSTRLLHYNYNNKEKSTREINFIISFLFPSPKNLSKKYFYAKKYPLLIIVAWIHRIAYTLYHSGLSIFEQIRSLCSTSTIARDRLKLLRWLQL